MFKLLKKFDKKQLGAIFVSFVLIVVVQVWLELKMPDYMTEITKLVKTNGTVNDILVQGCYMLLCAGGSLLSAVIVGYITTNVSASFSRDLEKIYLKMLNHLVWEEIKNFPLVV